MSLEVSAWAIRQLCETPAEKAVLLVLANYAGADGTCWPGQETVATYACCSKKSVERSLATFEERGWITRERRRRPDGYRTSDVITFRMGGSPEKPSPPLGDTLSGNGASVTPSDGPTRHPVHSHTTSCPTLPDMVSLQEPLVEPLEIAVAATRVNAVVSFDGSEWPISDVAALSDELTRAANTVRLDPSRSAGLVESEAAILEWRDAGVPWRQVVDLVRIVSRKPGRPITSWRFFDHLMADAVACWGESAEPLQIPSIAMGGRQ